MKYRVDLGYQHMEKWEKNTPFEHFRRCVPVHFDHVPVHFVFWSFLANVYRYTLGVYRYTLFCIPSFDQFLYICHNFLISYPI